MKQYSWQYDETVQVGVDYMNAEQVRDYDEHMSSLRDVSKEIEQIRQYLAVDSQSVIWEIGTGTGEFAIGIADHCREVYAADISPAMLETAKQKAKKRGIENIYWGLGGFLSGFQPENSVDAVVTQFALHHLPDFWKSIALSRIVNKLRTGGRLFLKDVIFPSHVKDYTNFFNNAIEDVRIKAGQEVAQETADHIKIEYSTLDWIIEGMIERAGLQIINKDFQGLLAAYVCGK